MRKYIGFIVLCFIGFISNSWADVILTYEALTPLDKDLPVGTIEKLMISEEALRADIGEKFFQVFVDKIIPCVFSCKP